jgi:diguanylate cyclase (GGDEF)-like protein/PAS domain S-box-containing protein
MHDDRQLQTAEGARVADALHARFFELSMDLLGTFDPEGRLLTANRAWEETLGWRRDELIGRRFRELVHPDDLPAMLDANADLSTPGRQRAAFENRWRHADGSYRRLLWSAAVHDGIRYCVAKDVTAARWESEGRQRDAELAQTVAASMADGLYVADPAGLIRYVNAAALRLLGYEADELVGKPAHATLHHSRADGTAIEAEACALLAVRRTQVPFATAEDVFWRRDGSPLPVAYSSSPVALGKGTGTVVVFRDISGEHAAAAARAEAEGRLRRSESLHRTLAANIPDTTVFLLDRDLRVLVAEGDAITRLPWFSAELVCGRRLDELHGEVPAEVLDLALRHYRATFEGEHRAFEFTSAGATFSVQAVPVRGDEDGDVEAALVVARDVTEERRAARQLARRARQQDAVAELGRFALGSHDVQELVERALETATATLGVELGTVLAVDEAGEDLRVVAAVGAAAPLRGARVARERVAAVRHCLETGETTIVEDLRADGRFAPSSVLLELGVASSLGVVLELHGRPFGVVNLHARERAAFSAEDASFLSAVATVIGVAVERDREERATRHAALHDPLTGLPNRTLALDRLAHALARRRREGIGVAVLALDLDRFKTINDSLGHRAGDEVLLALAPRLTAAIRPTDTVARIGGDEFVVVCPDVAGARGAAEVADRLASAICRPLALNGGEHVFTVSTGIALASSPESTPDSLLRDADAALYRAKDRGRGRFEVFDEETRRRVLLRLRTETELRRALARDELQVFYQPVIDLATGRPVSMEALVRWEHPERGLVPPLEFVPIAEETGLIAELGLQVLRAACRQTAAWQRQADPALGVSVNVSGRQLTNRRFPAQVAEIADDSGLAPGTLALEITESVLMEETEAPAAILAALREHGLTAVLDDFGTGYSSLGRLKGFPLDALKIDRSFVRGVASDGDDRAIVKATIDMAHALGLAVVAEGVETRAHEASLRALGCDRTQGYLYARPQPAEAIAGLVAAR